MGKRLEGLFVVFLVVILSGCFPLRRFESGFANPEEAARRAIQGTEGGPFQFRTLELPPDRAFVAFTSAGNTLDELQMGYAAAVRRQGGWNAGLVTQMGFTGEERAAVANLIALDDMPGRGFLLVGLVDPQIAGAEVRLSDGPSGLVSAYNNILLATFDLKFPPCGIELQDEAGDEVANIDFMTGMDPNLGEKHEAVMQAIAAACGDG